ncbi:alkaline phosphatase D family protein [Parvibaculum sp.]|uniref:alkaline phosphatase D family protein n=1 Tax=Parvibaculum sp. TaxID=2024848 RepID=UPI003298798C
MSFRPTRRDALKGFAFTGGAALIGTSGCSETPAVPVEFLHGVASGDPEATAVIIWTRATTTAEVSLLWQVAKDEGFDEIVSEGEAPAKPSSDYTVKVDVRGLEPGKSYFYRFLSGETVSPVGRTRTLAAKDATKLRLGVISCSHYGFGFYNVYRELAKEPDLDAIVHLGDYIYEYGPDGYGGPEAKEIGREQEPPHEIVTLEDYRTRFSQYRRDADLQAAHAAAPFITIWDDHETANNSWAGGAQNHQPDTEGKWETRRDAALRAYFEWMPMRDPGPGEAFYRLHRTYEMGEIATLHLIETRLAARGDEVSYEDDMVYFETAYDVSDPQTPVPLSAEAAASLPASQIEWLKTPWRESDGTAMTDYGTVRKWADTGLAEGYAYKPDLARFREEVLGNPERKLLGDEQMDWIAGELKTSRAKNVPWQVLGNQVIMARMDAPDYTVAFPPEVIEPAIRDNEYTRRWVERTKLRLPINPGAWDGYPASRQRFYEAVREAEANLVVLTGDSHQFWANDLRETPGGKRIGVEFGTSSVSSKGGYDYLAADPRVYDIAEETLLRDVPEIVYCETRHRGFILLEITAEAIEADYRAVSTVRSRDYTPSSLKRLRVTREGPGELSKLVPV